MSARICQKSQSKGKSCFDRVALLLKKILCKSVSFSSFALWVCPKASSVYRNRLVNDNISKNCILYSWGYLGYVLKFQTHIDMLTCLLFRKCLGGRPNLEEIFCQSQHSSDINPGLTNPLLIRMISTVISMGFQDYIGVSFSMFVQLVSWKWSWISWERLRIIQVHLRINWIPIPTSIIRLGQGFGEPGRPGLHPMCRDLGIRGYHHEIHAIGIFQNLPTFQLKMVRPWWNQFEYLTSLKPDCWHMTSLDEFHGVPTGYPAIHWSTHAELESPPNDQGGMSSRDGRACIKD